MNEAVRRERRLSCALLGTFLVLTAFLSYRLPIWIDEAYTLATTSGSLTATVRRAVSFELQPPGYFIAIWLWRKVAESLLWSRLFGVCCVGFAALIGAKVSRRISPTLSPGWAMSLIAFNPFAVWAAVELRPYALAVLIGAALLWAFASAFLGDCRSKPWLIAYVLLGAIALYTQYYTAFLLPAQGAVLVVMRRWRALKDYLLVLFVVALIALPLLLHVPYQVRAHTPPNGTAISLARSTEVLGQGLRYIAPLNLSPDRRWLALLGVLPPLLLLAGSGCPLRDGRRTGTIWFAVSVLVASGITALVATRLGRDLTSARHTIALLAPTMLLLIALVGGGQSRRPAIVFGCILALDSVLLLGRYRPLAKSGDSERVAALLAAVEPGAPIFVSPSEFVLPLRYYFHASNAIVALPFEPSLDIYDPRAFAIRDSISLSRRIAEFPPVHCTVWLVSTPVREIYGVEIGQEVLEEYVARHYQQIEDHRLAGDVRVRRLEALGCRTA